MVGEIDAVIQDKGLVVWITKRRALIQRLRELEEVVRYGTVSIKYHQGELQWVRLEETVQVPL